MIEPTLQTILPAFLAVFLALVFLWSSFRKKSLVVKAPYHNENLYDEFLKMKRMDFLFKIILLAFALMIIVYSLLPEFYYVFVPFEPFNHPLINTIGLLILKISVAWIVVAQISIDKEIFKYNKDYSNLSAFELFMYSQKILLSGLIIMFVGIFVTITNLIGILLGVMALVFYFKVIK